MRILSEFRIKERIKNHSVLAKNFSYLTLLEIFGMLFPLLTYPYLIRIFGKDVYGLVLYVNAIITYLSIIINFGFNVSVTKDISQNRENIEKLKEIFTSVYILKSCIGIVVASIYIVVIYCFHIEHSTLYYLSLGLCLQEILFPIWFFQGVEKMKFITIISFSSRLFFLICIFIFVKNDNDYLLVPIINSLGGLLTGIISIWVINDRFKVHFVKVQLSLLKKLFIDSIPFFTSRLSSLIVERTNTIIIGNTLGFGDVAIYDLAYKVINILKTPIMLIAQVLYPNVARTKDMQFVRKVLYMSVILSICMGIGLIVFAPICVRVLGSDQLLPAVPLLRLLSIYLPIITISTILGASTFVVTGHIKEYNVSVIISFICYVLFILIAFMVNYINLYTLTIIYILTEASCAAYRYYKVKHLNIF